MPTQIFIRSPDDLLSCRSLSNSPTRHTVLNSSRQSSLRLRRRPPQSLSSRDISASPRLSGYLFIFTAYIVLFVSSMKFAQEEESVIYKLAIIEEWKKLSTIIGSASISFLVVLIISVHFDMVCVPNLWLAIFKDGSYGLW